MFFSNYRMEIVTADSSSTSLTALPEETLINIFQKCQDASTPEEFLNMLKVCKSFTAIIERSLTFDFHRVVVHHPISVDIPVVKRRYRNLQIFFNEIYDWDKVSIQSFAANSMMTAQFVRLDFYKMVKIKYVYVMLSQCQFFKYLNELSIDFEKGNDYNHYKAAGECSEIIFPHVSKFTVSSELIYHPMFFRRLRMPKIKIAEIFMENFGFIRAREMYDMWSFLRRHANTLEELKVSSLADEEYCFEFSTKDKTLKMCRCEHSFKYIRTFLRDKISIVNDVYYASHKKIYSRVKMFVYYNFMILKDQIEKLVTTEVAVVIFSYYSWTFPHVRHLTLLVSYYFDGFFAIIGQMFPHVEKLELQLNESVPAPDPEILKTFFPLMQEWEFTEDPRDSQNESMEMLRQIYDSDQYLLEDSGSDSEQAPITFFIPTFSSPEPSSSSSTSGSMEYIHLDQF